MIDFELKSILMKLLVTHFLMRYECLLIFVFFFFIDYNDVQYFYDRHCTSKANKNIGSLSFNVHYSFQFSLPSNTKTYNAYIDRLLFPGVGELVSYSQTSNLPRAPSWLYKSTWFSYYRRWMYWSGVKGKLENMDKAERGNRKETSVKEGRGQREEENKQAWRKKE